MKSLLFLDKIRFPLISSQTRLAESEASSYLSLRHVVNE
jgi:hypothetical protein